MLNQRQAAGFFAGSFRLSQQSPRCQLNAVWRISCGTLKGLLHHNYNMKCASFRPQCHSTVVIKLITKCTMLHMDRTHGQTMQRILNRSYTWVKGFHPLYFLKPSFLSYPGNHWVSCLGTTSRIVM